MLSEDDRVTTQGAYLTKDGETVVVRMDGEVALRLTLEEVRGVEGDAAHVYFGAFDHLIVRGKKPFLSDIEIEDHLWIERIACFPFYILC